MHLRYEVLHEPAIVVGKAHYTFLEHFTPCTEEDLREATTLVVTTTEKNLSKPKRFSEQYNLMTAHAL